MTDADEVRRLRTRLQAEIEKYERFKREAEAHSEAYDDVLDVLRAIMGIRVPGDDPSTEED